METKDRILNADQPHRFEGCEILQIRRLYDYRLSKFYEWMMLILEEQIAVVAWLQKDGSAAARLLSMPPSIPKRTTRERWLAVPRAMDKPIDRQSSATLCRRLR